jgi:hypothetical protein
MYEALQGSAAFPEARKNAGNRDSYRPAATLAGIEPAIAELVMRLVSIDRSERPKSAAEVASTLRTWLAEHHPQGVEQDLAARTRQARATGRRRPVPSAGSAAAVSSGRIEVRSLAISPAMQELLQQATVRIEPDHAEPPEPGLTDAQEMEQDPEAHRVARRFFRDILVVTAALAAAVWWTNHYPRTAEEDYVDTGNTNAVLQPTPLKGAPVEPVEPDSAETARGGLPKPPLPAGPKDLSPNPPAAQAATPVTEPLQPSAAAGAGVAAKPGFLTVSAAPWARVQLDGKDAGVTPRRHLPVKPGKHTLLLECPPLGKDAKVQLEVQSEQAVQVLVDLNETPAKIQVR